MKRVLLATALSFAALTSNATVINFDNTHAAPNSLRDFSSLDGFQFSSGVVAIDTVGSAWNYGTISGEFVMLNNDYDAVVITKIGNADFTFDGLWAKTWNSADPHGGNIYGYNNGQLVYSSAVELTRSFTQFAGFSGKIDELRIDLGGFYMIDDLAVNETKVPEPASLALLALGLAGIAAARRRKQA